MLHITPSERMTLKLLADGMPTGDIADSIGVRPADLSAYIGRLFAKMGVSNSTEAVAAAVRRGLLVTESAPSNQM